MGTDEGINDRAVERHDQQTEHQDPDYVCGDPDCPWCFDTTDDPDYDDEEDWA